VLNHLTLDEAPGPHPFASFLVNMPRLFERFLARRLRVDLPRFGLRVVAQRYDFLDEAGHVGIRPDVLVYPRTSDTPVLVLDTKYRDVDDPHGDLNRDLYQVSAYLDRYGLREGVLVYPQFRAAAHNELRLRGTGKHLHVTSVNLAANEPAELERHCALLAEQVAGLALIVR
jgi:5-methylcytosine-specific restriction enzyme subunit McrC